MITGKDPEYPDDKQVIITVSWIPLHDLDRYDLYPPFLADYIRTKSDGGLENAVPEFFASPE